MRFVCTAFLALNSLSGDMDAFYFQVKGEYLSQGEFISCFQESRGGLEYPTAVAVS